MLSSNSFNLSQDVLSSLVFIVTIGSINVILDNSSNWHFIHLAAFGAQDPFSIIPIFLF